MRKYIFTMMVIAVALSACNKEQNPIIEVQTPNVNSQETSVFTATVENAPGIKATYNDSYKCASWEVGDRISINGKTYSAQTAGATTSFKPVVEGQEAEGDTYKAYFPASLYDGTTATLPAIQTYKVGKFDMPMYAESTNTTLAFKNLCAVLVIKVTSEDIATLKSIKVASDKKMNGTFSVSEDKAVLGEDGTNVVVLESAETLTLTAEGTTFYIAIPAQEYKYLNIFLSSDGTTYTQAMATKKAAGLGGIARSKIFNIDYAKNATKLWEGNIFVADCNIGANTAIEYINYFSWGGSTYKSTSDYYEGEGDLSGEHDTATHHWGRNWRMPTKTELDWFITKSTYQWTENYLETGINGMLCTGMGGSIFLPAAGYCGVMSRVYEKGSVGNYWSSSRYINGSIAAYTLYFDKDIIIRPEGKYYDVSPYNVADKPMSVRAVLEEPW